MLLRGVVADELCLRLFGESMLLSLSSCDPLDMRGSISTGVRRSLSLLTAGIAEIRRLRCQCRFMPLMTNDINPETSLRKLSVHHDIKRKTALMKRSGKMVRLYSQASRHASVPNHKTCSSWCGRRRKFNSLSNLTFEGSYGNSLLPGR